MWGALSTFPRKKGYPKMSGKDVRGYVQPATPVGFINLIAQANEMHPQGYRLLQVVQLKGDQLGAIFVPAPRGDGSLL